MNNEIRKKLIEIYGNKCWLFDTLSNKNKLTLHHIYPVRKEELTNIENGALLSRRMHSFFNELEREYPLVANELNYYFYMYKGIYPYYVKEKII